MIPLALFPTINACLNAASAMFLSSGYLCIRSKKVAAHAVCMAGAVTVTVLFLTSYLYYHFHVGATKFPGHGWIRPVYFTILISHTIFAVAIVPLVLITLARAVGRRFERHAKLARWTLPLWFYVSVTGVIIYRMLAP